MAQVVINLRKQVFFALVVNIVLSGHEMFQKIRLKV